MTGEKILNYKIENLTGENQLFRSFIATHTQFAKRVIVKILKPLESFLEKADFIDEIKRISAIQHPNVITLYDHLETADDFYLVFEYVEGKSLADHIHKVSGPIPEAKTQQLFVKILDAFSSIHHKGIVNGAISASNIIITPDENIKVLDLALSKFFNEKSLKSNDPEALSYASPEYFKGLPTGKRSDIYALGIILFQMLTGKNPYEKLSLEEIKHRIIQEPLPEATDYYPMISKEMKRVLAKATAKDPNDRFENCEAFKQAIQAFMPEEKPSPSTLEMPSEVSPVQQEPITTEFEEEETVFVNVPLIILGVLTVIFGFMLYRFNQKPPQQIPEVAFEMNNSRIRAIQDSLDRVLKMQALEDSMRIFQNARKKDSTVIYYHKVNRGETLADIAKLYYLPLDTLKSLNNMTGNERLKVLDGIKVRVRTIYKLKRNETLATVSRKFNVSQGVLKQVNKLYPKRLEPGEEPEPLIYEGKNLVIPLILSRG